MHRVFNPSDVSSEGLVEFAQDATAPKGLLFYHAKEGRPLATPWQVAALRAQAVAKHTLPDGVVLDCACGSGIQLAAYASTLQRPVLGVELDEERARASAVNLQTVATHAQAEQADWFCESAVLAGDGTAAEGVLAALEAKEATVAFLHLDPARPRNSRTHALEEMQPPLHTVLASWAPYFSPTAEGAAALLDLSPRLTAAQRVEVEEIVDHVWPGIDKLWEWTSRGRGRVDRLALWLGGIASEEVSRRFVRVPPSLAQMPLVLSTKEEEEPLVCRHHPPKRGEHVSILDAALIESGLVSTWLARTAPEDQLRWASTEGRRPQVHHDRPLQMNDDDSWLVQATGKVVELLTFALDETTVDRLVEMALEHRMASVKLRFDLDPALQPVLQGSLDRQLRRRHGVREGFVARHPVADVLLLCVSPAKDEDTPSI
ncbi:MAG TPA: class I SAM-dependent methyltransferase [Candidatus Poseidoniales archaeon]|nr:MAG TPA: class I SAM-dependent methyltransferase [Candidatus Poseidoniales archaeon]|tara:strand:- start:77 stop:1369 length:1293 start_codon:yes stop_codon:yes gene_type:complete